MVKVADGDTITVLHNGRQEKVRFHGIDTPEKKQAYGQEAKKLTASLVAGKTVTIKPITTGKYGRTIGIVYLNGVNVNEQIVKNGFAWVYRKYCDQDFCSDWLKLEANARSSNIGLWRDSNPVEWIWRHSKKRTTTVRSSVKGGTGIYHGNKKSHTLHGDGCKYYNCKNCTVIFHSIEDGISTGYRPHYECIKQ